jgi:hypothetical protein
MVTGPRVGRRCWRALMSLTVSIARLEVSASSELPAVHKPIGLERATAKVNDAAAINIRQKIP